LSGLESRFSFIKNMKTKLQKGEEMKKAKVLLDKSEALIFADFTKITAENLRKLRTELKKHDANFLVIKKRLLGLLLKERGIDVDLKQFKTSVGTIFSEGNSEKISGPAYTFFSKLEVPEGGDKQMWVKKILAGYDIKGSVAMDAQQIIFIGKLPPREAILGQLLGLMVAPLRSFMYLLDQKSKQSVAPAASSTPATTPDEKVELTQAQ